MPDQQALRTLGGAATLTWAEYAERVRRAAAGLSELGVTRGDVVACMLTNRPAFHIVDAAAMHLGAVSFSVYNQSSVEQLSYVLAHAGTRALVTERQFVATLRATGVAIDHLIVVDDGGLDALQNQGDAGLRPRRRAPRHQPG